METEKVVSTHALDFTHNETVELIRHAQESDAADRLLTIRQALSKYKKAVFWAMFLSTSLVMEGYDLVIVSAPPESEPATRACGVYLTDNPRLGVYRSIHSMGRRSSKIGSEWKTQ